MKKLFAVTVLAVAAAAVVLVREDRRNRAIADAWAAENEAAARRAA